MKILFTTLPAISHLRPMLPLARTLRSRGHAVAVAASERMREQVVREGLGFFAVGLPWLESEAAHQFPELREMSLDQQGLWWVTDIFADRAARPTATDLAPALASWSPDLVVRDVWDFGAWAAAEAAGIPTAVVGLAMHQPVASVEEFLGDRLAGLRTHVGSDPDAPFDSLYAGPYVDLLPATWQYAMPPNRVPLRPVEIRRPVPAAPELCADLPHDTSILVTFGTVFNHVPGVFETVIDALADEPVNVLVTTGLDRDPAELAPLPPNVVARRFVVHDELLPHLDAVVCHAGLGTTMGALAHDLPVVAVPLSADQPVHALRCSELGAGVTVPHADVTADAVASAVRKVLDDGDVQAAAAGLGRELRAMPGPSEAADHIEAHVGPSGGALG